MPSSTNGDARATNINTDPNASSPAPLLDHTKRDPSPTTAPAAQTPLATLDVVIPSPTVSLSSPYETDAPRRRAPPPPARTPLASVLSSEPDQRSSLMIPEDSTSAPASNRVSAYSVQSMDDGDESDSDDSVLSWWSDDGSEAGDERPPSPAPDRDEDRKRREGERQKALAAAGLKIRRDAPSIPDGAKRGKPGRRRAPAPPTQPRPHQPPPERTAPSEEAPVDVDDAYARYEAFLAEAKSRPTVPTVVAPRRAARPASMVSVTETTSSTGAGGLKEAASHRLSGFFSRLGVAGVGGGGGAAEKPKISGPIISGPIAASPISGPMSATPTNGAESDPPSASASASAPEFSSDFGKTWSSLVDPSVVTTMSDRERKRQESIFEFIATESSYVRDLQLIVGVFYARLMTLLPDKALRVIFANVEDILMLATFFLSSLEDRQKECRLYVDTIGDVLAEHCQNLEVYMPYCVNQDFAAKLLVQLRNEDPVLEQALVEIRGDPSVRGLDLSSYLLEPSECTSRERRERASRALVEGFGRGSQGEAHSPPADPSATRHTLPPPPEADCQVHDAGPGPGGC